MDYVYLLSRFAIKFYFLLLLDKPLIFLPFRINWNVLYGLISWVFFVNVLQAFKINVHSILTFIFFNKFFILERFWFTEIL